MKYCVILKGKRGEQTAVRQLSSRALNRTFITFEVPPIPVKFKDDEPGEPVGLKHSVEAHLNSFCLGLNKKMIPSVEFGIDMSPLQRHSIRRASLVSSIIDPLKAAGLAPIPVIGLSDEFPYFSRLVDYCSIGQSPFVVRVSRQECNFPGAIQRRIAELSQTVGVPLSSIRLLFDFGSITIGDIEEVADVSRALEEELPLHEYAMASTVAASMPDSQVMLLGLKYGQTDLIPRAEWSAWKRASLTQIGFGDYGITHPDDYVDVDFRLVTLGGKIRYTTPENFMVMKGKKLKDNGDQFHYLASTLRETGLCNAPTYCWGDHEIAACAQRERGPGTLESWIAFSTNHHVTLASRQLANAA